jgi:hypothetical protein
VFLPPSRAGAALDQREQPVGEQRGHRLGQLISGDRPLDVLRRAEVPFHAPRQLGDLDRLLRGDGALALSPAGSLVALYHPLVTHRLARD